jgi:DNA-binding response OmpR family regulator
MSVDRAITPPTLIDQRAQALASAIVTRVLVVDDDAAIRHLIAINLELEGFEVSQAADGQECLEVAAAEHPKVVVLDVAMPRLDGLAATVALKQRDPGIKVVIVSARAQQADVRKGLEAGADAYITKPFEPEALIRTVRDLANQAGTPGTQR